MINNSNKSYRKVNNKYICFFSVIFTIIFIVCIYIYYKNSFNFYFSKTNIILNNGSNYQIELLGKNNNYLDYSNYLFEVVDPSVAKIDKYGNITGLSNGITEVKVKCKKSLLSKKIKLSVENINVKSIKIINNESINKNETVRLETIINGNENIISNIDYKSSNDKIIKVDSNGNITGLKEGVASIYVLVDDIIFDTKLINVIPCDDEILKIDINEKDLILSVGEKKKISYSIYPLSASESGIIWESSDNSIVSVNNDGEIEALSEGTAILKINTNNDISSEVVVNVINNSLIINPREYQMYVGDNFKISTNKEVSWSSSNNNIAFVNEYGIVSALKSGIVKISAKTSDGQEDSCLLNVINNNTSVNSVTLNKKSLNMKIGETDTLVAIINPSNAGNKNITWTSSDENIVVVDSVGNIMALKEGIATITIKSDNGKIDECSITVEKNEIDATFVHKSIELYTDDTINIRNTLGLNSTKYELNISSDSLIDADGKGNIIAKKPGLALIGVNFDGNYIILKVNIKQKNIDIESINFDKESVNIFVDSTDILSLNINPINTNHSKLEWTSSDTNIVTVDSNGKIMGISEGEANITVKSDNNKTASIEVNVLLNEVKPTYISLDKTSMILNIDDSVKLNATIIPSNAAKSISWSSSNPNIVSVDNNGNITALKSGDAVITVTSSNGISTSCKIFVKKDEMIVNSIKIKNNIIRINKGDFGIIGYDIYPINASNKIVKWTSSNPNVAIVNKDGKVTGINNGIATIKATTSNGKVTKTNVIVSSNFK